MLKITNKEKTKLEKEIDAVLSEMENMNVSDDDYEIAIEHLSRLYDIKLKDKKWNISNDTMLVVAGNLLGIMLILKHEDLNIITSKALGFVIKGRA